MEKTCMWCGGNFYEGFECKLCGDNNPNLVESDYPDFVDGPIDSGYEIKDDFLSAQDLVNEPDHYSRWPIEPITFIMRNGFEFWRGNIVKYASRAGYKQYDGKTMEESEITDLEKVIRYAEMRINQINGETKL